MLNVIIVDDEALVRVGLRSMILWEDYGFEIIGEAANGQAGLDLIIKHQPDLVITDIKMPVLDGLEMIKLALKADHKPTFIILSSYDEFQLVKQAMKLGAEEYLIKLDLEPDSLINTLSATREKILKEYGKFDEEERVEKGIRENIAMLREGFFKQIINRPVRDQHEVRQQLPFLGIELDEARLACALVRMNDMKALEKYNAGEFHMLEVSFQNTINEIINDVFKGYTFNWNHGEFVIIYSAEPALSDELYREKAIKMAERLIQVLKQYFNIPVSIGVSNLFQGYPKLAQAYFESCRAVQHSLYSGSEPVLFSVETAKSNDCHERITIAELREVLPKAVEFHDLEAIRTVFKDLVSTLDEQTLSLGQAFDICFQMAYLIGGTTGISDNDIKEIIGYHNSLYESILTLSTLPEVVNWLTGVEQSLCRFLSRNEEQKNHRLIAKAKKYIMEHYTGEISLSEVAAALNISHGYFSTIFRQYTGICFTDYVNQAKIDRAKKLLRESDFKIYEISSQLGYQNAYYFSKVFKKITGMTPSEFSGKKI